MKVVVWAGGIPAEQARALLQYIRDLEQQESTTRFSVQVQAEEDMSTAEAVAILKSITPPLARVAVQENVPSIHAESR